MRPNIIVNLNFPDYLQLKHRNIGGKLWGFLITASKMEQFERTYASKYASLDFRWLVHTNEKNTNPVCRRNKCLKKIT